MDRKKILRLIDANFNRCKEGLRVVEDFVRFVLEDDKLRKKVRRFRHNLDEIIYKKFLKLGILERNSKRDLGRFTDFLELKRKNYEDILFVNLQRVKESLRVLEEVLKLIFSKNVKKIKKIRYDIYDFEKELIKKILFQEKNK